MLQLTVEGSEAEQLLLAVAPVSGVVGLDAWRAEEEQPWQVYHFTT